MTTITQTSTILDTDYDVDTLVDIVNHGMSSGVGGYIYYTTIESTFNEYEDEIMTFLNFWFDDNYGTTYINQRAETKVFDSLSDIKGDALWTYVELKAHDILMQQEHPSVY